MVYELKLPTTSQPHGKFGEAQAEFKEQELSPAE